MVRHNQSVWAGRCLRLAVLHTLRLLAAPVMKGRAGADLALCSSFLNANVGVVVVAVQKTSFRTLSLAASFVCTQGPAISCTVVCVAPQLFLPV